MKKTVKIICLAAALLLTVCFAACSASGVDYYYPGAWTAAEDASGNEYREITENPVQLVSENPTSRFAMDANTAAYANLRRAINEGRAIDKNQVRIEDMVNYFRYGYPSPADGSALALGGTVFPCPWNAQAKLLTVNVKARDIEFSGVRNNLVFLLDISGSMNSPDKMQLMQSAFCMLTENLGENDYVSVVTYAGGDSVRLDGARGYERKRIQNTVEDLTAGGSTAGASGIQTAYALAQKHFIEGGNNRIILATDGDFNVGVSSEEGLKRFVGERRNMKIGLTVLGFGFGNLKDNKLETIAAAAFEGNYGYIDSVLEARKILVEEIGGTLVTVARDCKAQVTFNPARVYSYRLLGYENKLLTQDEWEDSAANAGDVGAGHCVTAVYEIVLAGETDPDGAFAELTVRYKEPTAAATSRELTAAIGAAQAADSPNADAAFISAVVETALVLRGSEYKGLASFAAAADRLGAIEGLDGDPYKAEFLELVEKLISGI